MYETHLFAGCRLLITRCINYTKIPSPSPSLEPGDVLHGADLSIGGKLSDSVANMVRMRGVDKIKW